MQRLVLARAEVLLGRLGRRVTSSRRRCRRSCRPTSRVACLAAGRDRDARRSPRATARDALAARPARPRRRAASTARSRARAPSSRSSRCPSRASLRAGVPSERRPLRHRGRLARTGASRRRVPSPRRGRSRHGPARTTPRPLRAAARARPAVASPVPRDELAAHAFDVRRVNARIGRACGSRSGGCASSWTGSRPSRSRRRTATRSRPARGRRAPSPSEDDAARVGAPPRRRRLVVRARAGGARRDLRADGAARARRARRERRGGPHRSGQQRPLRAARHTHRVTDVTPRPRVPKDGSTEPHDRRATASEGRE